MRYFSATPPLTLIPVRRLTKLLTKQVTEFGDGGVFSAVAWVPACAGMTRVRGCSVPAFARAGWGCGMALQDGVAVQAALTGLLGWR